MIAGTSFDIADVHDAWPRFQARALRSGEDRETLAKIIRKVIDRDALCLEGPYGFLVIGMGQTDHGTVSVVILMAVSRGEFGSFAKCEDEVANLARDMGADELEFHSDRRGWPKVLGPHWVRHGDFFHRGV